MDEIYGNLENYNDVNVIDELRSENKQLKSKLENYAKTIETLQRDFDKVSKEFKNLEFNYSSLLKTARAEIERKTQIISNLNVEKDMLVLESLKNGNRNKRNVRNFTHQNKETERISYKQLPEEESNVRRNSGSYHKRYKSKSKENFREDASKNGNSDKDNKSNPIQDQQLSKQCPTFSSDDDVVTQKQRRLFSDDNDTRTIDVHSNENSKKQAERFRNEKSNKLKFYPEEEKHYRSWNSRKYNEDTNKRRERCDSYRNRNHSSPVRYSKHRRDRVLESPPQIRKQYHERTRDFRPSYEKSHSHDRHYERDKNLFKHKTSIDFQEPENKRAKPSYNEEDLDKYAFVSCQSPDLLIDDDIPNAQPIIEIMGIAETTLEDPRKKSNKYEIKSENDKITLSTTCDRKVDLKVIDVTTWNNVTVPNALMQEPLEYNDIFIQEVYRDIENLATNTSVESGEIMDSVVINEDNIKYGPGNQERQLHEEFNNDFHVKKSDHQPCSKPEHNECLDTFASTSIPTTETSARESIVVMDSITNDAVLKCDTIIREEQEHSNKKFTNYFNMKDSNHDSSLKSECKISEESVKKSIPKTETGDCVSGEILDLKTTSNVSKHNIKHQEDEHCHKKLRYDFAFKESGYIPCPKPETNISFDPKKFRIPKRKGISQGEQCSKINTFCNTADKDVNTTKTDNAEVDLAFTDAGNNTEKYEKTTLSKEDIIFETKNHKTKKTVNEKKIKKPKKPKKRTDSVNEIKMLSNDQNHKLVKDNKTEKFSELFGDTSTSLITPEDLKLEATELKSKFISNMSSDLEDAQNAIDINVSDMMSVQSFKGIRDICSTKTDMKGNGIDEKINNNKDVEVDMDNVELRMNVPEDQNGALDPYPSIDKNENVVKTEIISTGFQPASDSECNILTPNIPQISASTEECHGKSFSATSTPNKSTVEVQQDKVTSLNNGDSIDQSATIFPNPQPDDVPDLRIRIVRRRRKVLKI